VVGFLSRFRRISVMRNSNVAYIPLRHEQPMSLLCGVSIKVERQDRLSIS
jgi:hypothetical protein